MKGRTALAGITIVAGIVLATPGIGLAHATVADGTCAKGVSWNAHDYDAQATNSIVVKIDGNVVYTNPSFGASSTNVIATDKTKPHTWSVVVNAPGTQFDFNLGNHYDACVVPPTTTTTTTIPVTTTTVAATTTTVADTTTTVSDSGTTTTVALPPPALVVLPPVPTVATTVPGPEPTLPRTGAVSGGSTTPLLASIIVACGIVCTFVGTRRRQRS